MMERVHYYNATKNATWGDAIAQGFDCRKVDTKAIVPGAFHCIYGLLNGCDQLLREVWRLREPYVFFDRAYFGGGPGTGRMRAVPNAYQHHWIAPDHGPRDWGVELKPWQTSGDQIMIVPPSSPALCGLFCEFNWGERIALEVRKYTKRPIFISKKGDSEPLKSRLARCHLVIAYTSNVAVDALVAGVPCIVSEYSAGSPCAGDLERITAELIESPPRPDREAWFRGLTWGQFTVEEVASGFAAEHMGLRSLASATI